ncbi:MAG: DUF2341 domain-containing protein [Terrimicrobiaceae bacterium]
MIFSKSVISRCGLPAALILFACILSAHAEDWWNKEWTGRKSFTVDTGAEGGAITDPIGGSVVLLRLHPGNFPFEAAKEDGSDIRFVAEDGKTILPHQIEKYDPLLTEAFVWVKVPEVKPGAQTKVWLYYGNGGEMEPVDPKKAYDEDTVLVYHFGEKGAAPADASSYGNTAEAPATASEGALIGGGIRLLGNNPLTIPASESLKWNPGSSLTWSAWIKAGALQPNATIFSRKEGSDAFRVGLDQGVPYVEVTDSSGTARSTAGEPLAVNVWKHLAVVSDGSKFTLYVDGQVYSSVNAATPAMTGTALIGGDGTDALGFAGEVDQVEISRVARPAGFLQLAAIGQGGTEKATKLLVPGEDEGGGSHGSSHMMEHLMLFGDIANNMMFDGWVVIFCCAIMCVVGWTVAIRKFLYLKKTVKADKEFLTQWRGLATDLTALDHGNKDNVKTLGGKVDGKSLKLMKDSPLYHIYHIGSDEIHDRQSAKGGFHGLSARSIQAIRASLDGGLQRELHRLNDGLVFLTISIAGGPYVGLLGTVMGVMITFAVIAKTGQVEVNSIAPGIASALLATVAGLIVAIPALFIYSYLNSLIKNSVSEMHMFIDEFISKIAEFYPETGPTRSRAERDFRQPDAALAGPPQ